MNSPAATSIYDALGGAPAVRRLADRFYGIMDELPEAYGLRRMHPEDLRGSADQFYEFLSGWFGGPPLYTEKKGHPRLRMRHMPFAIGPAQSAEWMLCMRTALDELVADDHLRQALVQAFDQMAQHMVNVAQPPTGTAAGSP